MEFEIADDPQGNPERAECRRDGGLDEDPIALHRSAYDAGENSTAFSPRQMVG